MKTEIMEQKATPTAMNMLAEMDMNHHMMEMKNSGDSSPIFVTPPPTFESGQTTNRARAINFTSEEQHAENGLSTNKTQDNFRKGDSDLSDVSMDDDEEEDHTRKNSANTFSAGTSPFFIT